MSYVTVYCVQTYRRQGRAVERARRSSYSRPADAVRDGAAAATRCAGVIVYAVEIDAALEAANLVRVLARHGQTPTEDAA